MQTNQDKFYIYGAGGHAKVVATVLLAQGQNVIGFLDDDPSKIGSTFLGLPILSGSTIRGTTSTSVIVGIGDNTARQRVFEKLEAAGIVLATGIHPSAVFHPTSRTGKGTIAMAGVIVNVDARIGENVILNTGVLIDHDCVIGNHVHLAPGVVLAGNAVIGEGAFLGVGARVIPGIKIGSRSIVGAGAVVIKDVPPNAKVVGVPAREI